MSADAARSQPPFTPQRAFVLQLREGTSFVPDRLRGRIEHVSSGKACLFESATEACSFMERIVGTASGGAP